MEQVLTPGQPDDGGPRIVAGQSAASWPAIVAGSIVAVGASLILLALGAGLGLASASPWADHGPSATAFGMSAAIWLVVTQWLSAALGGYIAGRLRSRWLGTHTHEVFFRDTAHGLITWAAATVVIAGLVGGSVHSLVSGGARAASAVVTAGGQGAASGAIEAYGTDKLFRPSGTPEGNPGPTGGGDARLEAQHIMANALTEGHVAEADRAYLVTLVAARTGLSPPDAQQRVDAWVARSLDAEARIKAAAEAARKAAAEVAIYTALSLLIGAFVASAAAALGGRLRDQHP